MTLLWHFSMKLAQKIPKSLKIQKRKVILYYSLFFFSFFFFWGPKKKIPDQPDTCSEDRSMLVYNEKAWIRSENCRCEQVTQAHIDGNNILNSLNPLLTHSSLTQWAVLSASTQRVQKFTSTSEKKNPLQKRQEKFLWVAQEFNLTRPDGSQWCYTLSYPPLLTMSCRDTSSIHCWVLTPILTPQPTLTQLQLQPESQL